ncbi:lysophospholipase II [Perkinsela sp. CCAP 1560/4]|nr:lysophospholipase II [Perkinsela sp. CCAP 1560/4]|eukprot:KNH07366.1 lysophospholipase II [Perkinsela sp. CCAP 1560/4]
MDILSLLRTTADKLNIVDADKLSQDKLFTEIDHVFSADQFFGEITIVEPAAPSESTLIWCHGQGETGESWKRFVAEKLAPSLPSMRFVLPTAPTRRLLRDPSRETAAWWDYQTAEADSAPDWSDLLVSNMGISHLAQAEHRRLSSSGANGKLFLGGFREGATLGMYSLYTSIFPYAGILLVGEYGPEDGIQLPSTRVPCMVGALDVYDMIPLKLQNEMVRFLYDNGVPAGGTAMVHSRPRPIVCEDEK